MNLQRVLGVALQLLGPLLLGVGTIFQPKANLTDHWSTSPKIVIQIETSRDESGAPLGSRGRRRPPVRSAPTG